MFHEPNEIHDEISDLLILGRIERYCSTVGTKNRKLGIDTVVRDWQIIFVSNLPSPVQLS